MGTTAPDTITTGRYRVEISHPDKELFDTAGLSKRDLAEHYASAAPAMLPHVRDRPIAVHRFPNGITDTGFYQKRRPDHAPDWVRGTQVKRETDGNLTMIVVDSAATLVWLANQAMITAHPWLSRVGNLRRPDRLVFDLDPPGDDFAPVKEAAHELRGLLAELKLPAYLMTTGSRGLHVVVPIRAELHFDDVRAFARDVADLLADRHPDRLTTELRKNRRRGRLFVDVLRNAYAQHSVAPYAVRPIGTAPVATPLEWPELDALGSARDWTLLTIGERLDADPWRGMGQHARSLVKARDRLRRLRERTDAAG